MPAPVCAPRRADAAKHSDSDRNISPTSFAGRFFETTRSYRAAALLLPCDQRALHSLRLVHFLCAAADRRRRWFLCAPSNEKATASGGLRDQSLKNPLLLPPNITQRCRRTKQQEALGTNKSPPDVADSDLWSVTSGGRFSVLAAAYTVTAERIPDNKRRD